MSLDREKIGLLFDLDGVIVHSMPLHVEAWRVYLGRHGVDPSSLEDRMHGRRNDEIVRAYFGGDLSDGEIFEHGAAKEALFREMMGENLGHWLVPGLPAFLARHPARPKAVGTNAEPRNVRFVLDGAGLGRHFDAVVDGMQVSRPKPDPEIYLTAAQRLGVPAERCIVFEDSPSGVAAGRAAGATVVGVTTTSPFLEGAAWHIGNFEDSGLDAWIDAQARRFS